jgi:4-amino-4-deoxy-L-arabinose transferase-like glycosyltransferase
MGANVTETAATISPLRDRVAIIGAAAALLLHAPFAGRYDLFRDELYFIVCGQHPAFGYVDQPPLVPLLAATLHEAGLGLWFVRLPVVLAAAALVWLAVRFARLLGGSDGAAALAAFACAIAPMLIGSTGTLNTSAFDPLAWTAIAFCLVAAMRRGEGRWLLVAGMAAGVILEVKYAALFWLAGLTIGLVATPERRLFAMKPLYLGAAVAAAIAAPSLVWQALHGFPFLELGAAAKDKNADVALLPFITNQIFVMNPALAPLWLAGLVAPFASVRLKDLRYVTIACAVVFVIVRVGHGKDYYLAPLYPTLFVVGAVALVPLLTATWRKLLARALIATAVALSAIALPLTLPVLPPERIAPYMHTLGVAPQQQERSFAGTVLPQHFADQLGWRDMAQQVEAAWARIPASERSSTAIVTGNYGEAAALDLFGRGLPASLSGHNQYFLWGLRGHVPRNLLLVWQDLDELRPFCRDVSVLGRTHSKFAMAYENGKAIALCSGLKQPLEQLWPQVKHFE